MTTDTRNQLIHDRLSTALSPTQLEVIDEGWQHIGHAEEGAGHFLIRIASPQFTGQSLIACHRLVHAALSDLMTQQIHALRIDIQPTKNTSA